MAGAGRTVLSVPPVQAYYKRLNAKPLDKTRMHAWGRSLRKQGMKFIAYNETSAARRPDDWQIWLEWNNFKGQ